MLESRRVTLAASGSGAHLTGVTPARFIPFSINLSGTRWSGDWTVSGQVLQVGSAYGSAERVLGRRKPEVLARELLVEILCARLRACEARAVSSANP